MRGAHHLHDIHRKRERLVPLPAALSPVDLAEAYAMQERLQVLFASKRGAVVGYKIAITTPVMQRLMGIDHPCGGAIFATMLHSSPARLSCSDYVNVAVECEIAVRLGADLPGGRRHDRDSVADAVDACMAAIEIIDDQNADYKQADALNLVANNAWNAGCVAGPAVTGWRRRDLAALQGRMLINGAEVGRGVGADVLGHPLTALAWLANTLAERGRPLRAGMIVSTGSIVSTKWPKPGDTVVAEIEGLGEAVATFV
ncbi:MAG: fumarylacetoacetate hydrolase family protein [Alphaproteobacteria bacterium]|nr:fumarylacetoacetate hydrolase family protein [Alphaproteobacteria bacterium]